MTPIELARLVKSEHQFRQFRQQKDGNKVEVLSVYDADELPDEDFENEPGPRRKKGTGWIILDAFTANLIIQVYEMVEDDKKEKLEKLTLTALSSLAFKVIR